MSLKKIFKAFSLAEITVVVSVLTLVIAAATPIITKRSQGSVLPESSLPSGVILMWNKTTPPDALLWSASSWAICDGSPGTPNLVNRFVYGAPNGATYGGIGGETTHVITAAQMPTHTHSYTVEKNIPDSHDHGGPWNSVSAGGHAHTQTNTPYPGSSIRIRRARATGSNYSTWTNLARTTGNPKTTHSHAVSQGGDTGAHIHTAGSSGATGGNEGYSVMPPYYTLIYIIKK